MLVSEASITLEITNVSEDSYDIFELLTDWNETETTWNNAAAGQPWQSPGAAGASDRDPTPLGTVSLLGFGALTIDLNADGLARVQQWVDDPQTNHGLILANAAAWDGMDFASNEAIASNTRPQLSIRAGQSPAIEPQYVVHQNPRLQLGDAPLIGYVGSESDQVEILWQTKQAGLGDQDDFVVQYRRAGNALWDTAGPVSTIDTGVETRIIHFVEVDGLDYAAEYEYRVSHLRGGSVLQTFQGTFRTRLPAGDATPFSFAAYGDSAWTPQIETFRAVQAQINSSASEFAILLGDTAYNNASHVDADARFDAKLNPEAAEWIAGHIDYLGIGDADVRRDGGQPIRDNFSVPIPVAGLTAPFAPPPTEPLERNYAFDYGLVHFVTLDTTSLNDANRLDQQLAWVENDLLSSNATWKIVFAGHAVAFSPDKPESPSNNYYQQMVPRLRAAGADLFMAGHSHTYSWTKPLLGYELDGEGNTTATFVDDGDKVYDKGAGLVQVVAGVGGDSVRSGIFSDPAIAAGFTSDTVPQGQFGFSLVEVSPSQLTVKYVPAYDLGVIDEFSIVAPTLPNVAPSFTNGPDQTVDEDSGVQTILNWATDISPGPPSESGQIVDFIVSNDNATLFSSQPTISPNGTLTFQPAPDVFGVTTVTVQLHDDGGTAGGGVDTSAPQVFTIIVDAVNDPPLGVPTITGTPQEDQLLTADTSGISDADGLGPFSYQWLRDGLVISGATGSTYTLGDGDVGTQVSLQVSYTDAQGTSEGPLTSNPTATVTNVNDPPLGVPTITGTPQEDQLLTADTSGISDADGLGPFSYQWLRDGLVISGATGSTYTLGDGDVGTQVSLQVSYTDAQGTSEGPLTSNPTATVTNVNDPPLGVPTITGTPQEDQLLTADTSGISDADGLGPFSYQWLRDGLVISGATGSTYTLGDGDVGTQVSLQVSYTDAQGTSEGPLTSNPTATVTNVNDPPLGVPTITGTPQEDQLLTADTSGISDADGLGPFSYQWLRDGLVISGATGSTYTLGDGDVGTQVSLQVSYTDAQGTSEGPLTSNPTATVTNVNDPPLGVPTITGTPQEDQLLTADTSGISDADGLGPFSYQWLRDGLVISGATGSTYTLGDGDVGTQVSLQVSYTDAQGTSEGPLTSNPTATVTNVNDPPLGVPTITGTPQEDQLLTADTSGISDADGLGPFSYQWLRDGLVISGATGSTYTLGDGDVGTQVSLQVSYTDAQGTSEGPLTSNPTATVTNVNDPPLGVPTITGTPQEDQLLTADTSGISDADGLGPFSYQWLRDGLVISGATGSTYTLGDGDVGTQVSLQVSYTDAQGTSEGPLTSNPTATVTNVNDPPLGVPTITGTPQEDQLLTADTSGISDADGLGPFSYQWLRDGLVDQWRDREHLHAGGWRCGRADPRAGQLHRCPGNERGASHQQPHDGRCGRDCSGRAGGQWFRRC